MGASVQTNFMCLKVEGEDTIHINQMVMKMKITDHAGNMTSIVRSKIDPAF